MNSERSLSTSLLINLQDGQDAAYVRLDGLFRQTVTDWFAKKWGLANHADDLTQDVFLRIQKGIKNFQPDSRPASFRRWMFTIASNVRADHLRRTKAVDHATDFTDPGDIASNVVELAREVHRMLDVIRSDFSPQTIQIFEEFWFGGKDTSELAEQYGKKTGAVRQGNHRVLHRLRDTFYDLYGPDYWPFQSC